MKFILTSYAHVTTFHEQQQIYSVKRLKNKM